MKRLSNEMVAELASDRLKAFPDEGNTLAREVQMWRALMTEWIERLEQAIIACSENFEELSAVIAEIMGKLDEIQT